MTGRIGFGQSGDGHFQSVADRFGNCPYRHALLGDRVVGSASDTV